MKKVSITFLVLVLLFTTSKMVVLAAATRDTYQFEVSWASKELNVPCTGNVASTTSPGLAGRFKEYSGNGDQIYAVLGSNNCSSKMQARTKDGDGNISTGKYISGKNQSSYAYGNAKRGKDYVQAYIYG